MNIQKYRIRKHAQTIYELYIIMMSVTKREIESKVVL